MKQELTQKAMIEAHALVKTYGNYTAVDDVSLAVTEGMIFGLLGPNAAGKTTTIRMLCGIIKSDRGEVRIGGKAVVDAKADFGYVAQHFALYEDLSVAENINFYAGLYAVREQSRVDELLHRYDLQRFADKLAGSLSGGYQRRLGIACALVHDPDVLFLDEPTAGIDPVTRKQLWDDLYRHSAAGKTIFLTTHYMEEAERCHQLGFLSRGRVVALGTPQEIRKAAGDVAVYATTAAFDPELHDELTRQDGVLFLNQFGDELRIIVNHTGQLPALNATIKKYAPDALPADLSEVNLEDVFIALTQPGAS